MISTHFLNLIANTSNWMNISGKFPPQKFLTSDQHSWLKCISNVASFSLSPLEFPFHIYEGKFSMQTLNKSKRFLINDTKNYLHRIWILTFCEVSESEILFKKTYSQGFEFLINISSAKSCIILSQKSQQFSIFVFSCTEKRIRLACCFHRFCAKTLVQNTLFSFLSTNFASFP